MQSLAPPSVWHYQAVCPHVGEPSDVLPLKSRGMEVSQGHFLRYQHPGRPPYGKEEARLGFVLPPGIRCFLAHTSFPCPFQDLAVSQFAGFGQVTASFLATTHLVVG